MNNSLSELHEPFIEWVYDQTPRTGLGDVDFREFSEAHGLDIDASFALLRQCKQRGFLDDRHSTLGGPIAELTGYGREWVRQRKERRSNRVLRIAAARNGLLRWLWERKQDGAHMPIVEDVLKSDESLFEGDRLTLPEIDRAAASLRSKGLISGVIVDQRLGPVRAETTDSGDRCVEEYGGDVSEYERQQRPGGTTYNIGGDNKGIIAPHGQNIQMAATFVEASKAAEIIKYVEQYRQAAPVLNLSADPSTELAQLTDELEQEASSSTPDAGRLRSRLQRVGDILNSQVVGGALGNMLAAGALALVSTLT